jgi:hypothetical protein
MLLIERALNRRWNLAPKLRDLAARWINEVLSHPEAYNERTVARAVSLAQAADRLDLDIDKFAVDHLDKHADEDSGAVKIIDKDFWNSVEE